MKEVEKYFKQWVEQNPKVSTFVPNLVNLIEKIEEASGKPIYHVDLIDYYHIICQQTKGAAFEICHRFFLYLNEFQHFLYETDHTLNATVTLSNGKAGREKFVEIYAKSCQDDIVYDDSDRLVQEMVNRTNYTIDNNVIAITQEEFNQCVIYLAFHGLSLDDIMHVKISDVEVTQDQVQIKIPNKKRYIFEHNPYIMKLFKKLVFTRYYAQNMEKTGRVMYIPIKNDWLVNTVYRIKKDCTYEEYIHNYTVCYYKPYFISKLNIYGAAVRAYNKNVLQCREQFLTMEDPTIFRLASYITGNSVSEIKKNRSLLYYGYALYLIVYNKNKNIW